MPTIGHYEVLEKLGEGGMGVVWKARDPRLERFVALKLLPAARTTDPERRRRFVQEARAASALNHPHIVTIYDINRAEEQDFIAMEYIAGKTLDQLIPKKGFRVNEALKYAIQIADALAAAHAAGIVHRDLKPGNVMVSDKGVVKVLDFGLAKLVEDGRVDESEHTRTIAIDAAHTEEGVIVGTASYMSPEQAEGKPVDARSDIFSFGALLYEMLSGRRAFRGDSQMSTLAAILNRDPEPLETHTEGLPRELTRLVMRCLRKDPERRTQSLADLKLALEELKEDSDSGLTTVSGSVREPRSRTRLVAAALVVAAISAGVAYRFWPEGNREGTTALSESPLTSYPGFEREPSFSPDGSQVAFSWNGETKDHYHIYIRMVGSGNPLRITNDPGADRYPAWSPDGKSIAFLRRSAEGEYSIWSVPPLGGGERPISSTGTSEPVGLAWAPDGRRLLVSLREPGKPFGLFVVSADTGEKRRLTSGKSGGDVVAALAPDGRTVAYGRLINGDIGLGGTGELYTLALTPGLEAGGEPRQHPAVDGRIDGLVWTADGKGIIFSSEQVGSNILSRIDASGSGKPIRLAVGANARSLAISPRSSRLIYEIRIPTDTNIWRLDLSEPTRPPAPLITSTRVDSSPNYSPDGKKIAFRSARSGADEIWVSDSEGSNATQITSRGRSGSPHWSPDGKRIAFDSVEGRSWQVFTVAAQGGKPQQLTFEGSNTRPAWSRDGAWIYFGSGRSGRVEIWKAPSGGGTALQITRNGAGNPTESDDGKTLYYDFRGVLKKANVDGSGETTVIDDVVRTFTSWFVRPDGIFYHPLKSPNELRFLSFSNGKSRVIAKSDRFSPSPVISPDGRYLLYGQIDGQPGSDLMLVENFH